MLIGVCGLGTRCYDVVLENLTSDQLTPNALGLRIPPALVTNKDQVNDSKYTECRSAVSNVIEIPSVNYSPKLWYIHVGTDSKPNPLPPPPGPRTLSPQP